ncbi:MAG: hypothetical protein DMG79_14935 [Acidobacteria bacterium]|nr:MAG: hypothetical protein DMG79_14935 [Acidobacteriota bacterium]
MLAGSRVPLWLKIAWTLWLLIWAPVYWGQYGAQNFLFFCDLGNVLIGIGLWMESALIFSWVACGLLLFQSLYALDIAGALLLRRHFIGGTEYMFDPGVPLTIRLLSLFHVVTPPLLLWAIWRLGYDPHGWKLQTLMAWIVVPINYFWRPEQDVNWARGLFFREQHMMPGLAYLVVYLIAAPLFVYFPTHLFLEWVMRRGRITAT